MATFLVALAVTAATFNIHKPRLLILQSYDKNYSWTRDVDVGIKRVLKKRTDFAYRWFYMDTKRHPSEEFKINAGKSVRRLIDSWQPTVVLAVDDDAQKYAMKYYVDNPKVKIVFAGVNSEPDKYGYDKANNVTGILERKPYGALKQTLLSISAARKRSQPIHILFLGDSSGSVRDDERYFSKFDWAPIQIEKPRLVKTFGEWKAAVDAAPAEGVQFIITSNYRKLLRAEGRKELVPPHEVVSWTETNSKVPVIGTNVFYTEDGGMLSVGTSPFEQGEVGARMAVDILDGRKTVADIPMQSTRQFVIAMHESRIKNRGIKLPSIYEAAALAAGDLYP
jgi:hypothetical protein